MALNLVSLGIIILAAFIPSTIYLIWIRNAETYQREPLFAVERVFIYGAVVALLMALVLEIAALSVIEWLAANLPPGNISDLLNNNLFVTLFAAIIIAPFVEEFTKATGVLAAGKRLIEPENGLVYGAACGLGFAASENVLYFGGAFLQGVEIFILTALLRTFTSTLLHTSATATTGYGISRSRCFKHWYGRPRSWFPFYLLAVLMHASFNFLASLGDIYGDQTGLISVIGLVLGFALVIVSITTIRRKIVQLDRDYRPDQIHCQ